ncbi:MAG: DUF2093 domain-containing protein [Alphaproteobacteria bacterium]|nr:DUF2093 domain-containing protein [Alphaproteobacteria bacterium]
MKRAVLRYLNGDFVVLEEGDYVVCALTGHVIPLYNLCYWSVELQEPYATAAASFARYCESRIAGVVSFEEKER